MSMNEEVLGREGKGKGRKRRRWKV